jgi:Flp pilus assembly protein TadD
LGGGYPYWRQSALRTADGPAEWGLEKRLRVLYASCRGFAKFVINAKLLAHILRAEKGDLEGAERHALLALKLSETETPRDPRLEASAYLNLANVYIQRQQFARHSRWREKGLAADRSQPNLHTVHGVALMQLGRIDEAQRVFLEVHQLLPNDELVLHYLGVIALQRREFEKAVSYFQKP